MNIFLPVGQSVVIVNVALLIYYHFEPNRPAAHYVGILFGPIMSSSTGSWAYFYYRGYIGNIAGSEQLARGFF